MWFLRFRRPNMPLQFTSLAQVFRCMATPLFEDTTKHIKKPLELFGKIYTNFRCVSSETLMLMHQKNPSCSLIRYTFEYLRRYHTSNRTTKVWDVDNLLGFNLNGFQWSVTKAESLLGTKHIFFRKYDSLYLKLKINSIQCSDFWKLRLSFQHKRWYHISYFQHLIKAVQPKNLR